MPWSPESYIFYLCPLKVRYFRDLCRAKLFFYLFFLLECMGSFFQSIPADRGATHVDAVPQDGRIIPVPSGMAGRRTACAAQVAGRHTGRRTGDAVVRGDRDKAKALGRDRWIGRASGRERGGQVV